MCDIRTYRRIEKTMETMMAFKQMFTAFDITLDLQEKGMRKRHRELRRDIKRVADDLMWRYGYERTLVPLQGLNASAFVYHPYGTDASLHLPTMRSGVRVHAKTIVPFAGVINSAQPAAGQNQNKAYHLPSGLAGVLQPSPDGGPVNTPGIFARLFAIVKSSAST